MGERRSVGIWFILRNGENAGKVLLQQRAEFPFICQPTCNGKVESKEGLIDAVFRKIAEELGPYFKDNFRNQWIEKDNTLEIFSVAEYTYKGKSVTGYNYIGLISQRQMELIKLHSGAMPEFVLVGKKDLGKIKPRSDKTADPKRDIILFDDQHGALATLFWLKNTLGYLR